VLIAVDTTPSLDRDVSLACDGTTAAPPPVMPDQDKRTLPSIPADHLEHVTGGIDPGAVGQQIGGLVDSFTGGGGQGSAIGGQIGGLVGSFLG